MFKNTINKTTLTILAACLVTSTAFAATISKTEYRAEKNQISTDYKSSKAACDAFTDYAKDVCIERAKGKEKVARAELEYSYTGKAKDAKKIPVVKADTTYSLAKELCNDKADNTKDVCMAEAKASHVKAISAAKMNKEVKEASSERRDDVREANYKVAKEKCDAFSGDTQDKCVADAKSQYNQ